MVRVNQEAVKPEDIVIYMGEKTPHWTPEGYEYDTLEET